MVSLLAHTAKNLPAKQETCVRSLGWEDPLEEGIATYSIILAWRIPLDRGDWPYTVQGAAKCQTRLNNFVCVCVCVCEMYIRRFSFLKYFQFWWPGVFSNLYRIIGIRYLILQLVNAKENRNGLSSRRCLRIELMYFSLPFKSTSHLMGIVLFFFFLLLLINNGVGF